MTELKWNEYEFIECLGVLPEVDEYETGHHFRVEKDGLLLTLSIWRYECLFELSLFQSGRENPLINFYLSVRDEARFINDKRGSYLSFGDCLIVPPWCPVTESIDFVRNGATETLTMELEVEPEIKIKFV
jgi:hypothetical protein